MHAHKMHKYHDSTSAVAWQMRSFPQVDYRYLFYMEEPLSIIGSLDFRNETTWPLQESGRSSAQQSLDLGEGTGFEKLMDWIDDMPHLEAEYGDFGTYLKSFLPTFE